MNYYINYTRSPEHVTLAKEMQLPDASETLQATWQSPPRAKVPVAADKAKTQCHTPHKMG